VCHRKVVRQLQAGTKEPTTRPKRSDEMTPKIEFFRLVIAGSEAAPASSRGNRRLVHPGVNVNSGCYVNALEGTASSCASLTVWDGDLAK
jgi:hypothetical protein